MHGGLEGAALGGDRVLDPDGRAVDDVALHYALGLELLEALGEEAIGDVRNQAADLREVGGPVEEDQQDGPRPALADQFDRAVVQGAAGRSLGVVDLMRRCRGPWS